MGLSQRVSMDLVRIMYAAQQYFKKHEALQQCDIPHMALQQYYASSKIPQQQNIDHFSKLPAELMVEIFGYLDVKTRIKALRVARIWQVNMMDRKIWQNFILDDVDLKNVPLKERSQALDPIRKFLTEGVVLVDIRVKQAALWSLMADAAHIAREHLKVLRISFAPHAPGDFDDDQSLRVVLNDLHSLEELELHNKAVDWLLYRRGLYNYNNYYRNRVQYRSISAAPDYTLPPKLKRLKLLNIYFRRQKVAWNLHGSVEELECSGNHIWTSNVKAFASTLRVLKLDGSLFDCGQWQGCVPLATFTKLKELSMSDLKTCADGPLPNSLRRLCFKNCKVVVDFTDGLKWPAANRFSKNIFGTFNAATKFPIVTSSKMQVWDMVKKKRLRKTKY